MADYVYTLSHHVWETDADGNGGFVLPAGTVAAVDLRNLIDCGAAGVEKEAVFLAMDPAAVIGIEHHVLGRGDLRDLRLSAVERSLWASVAGYTPQGDTLNDWLADHLLNGADPLGQSACKPLMPTVGNDLEIHLAGHSRVWTQAFRFGSHAHTSRVAAVLQEDFKRQFEDEQAGRSGKNHAAKCLDYWCDKYRIDKGDRQAWGQLVPAKLRKDIAGPVKHATSFTESWPTNSTTISTGQDQPWTEVLNDSEVSGGNLRGVSGNTAKRNRCGTALSGSDHYCQATITVNASNASRNNEVSVRFASAADTSYSYRIAGLSGGESIQKCVTGTFTSLTSGARTNSLDTIYLEANGSSLQAKYAGANSLSVTDTAITTGTQIGCGGNGSTTQWGLDSVVAADLAVSGGLSRIIGRTALAGAGGLAG